MAYDTAVLATIREPLPLKPTLPSLSRHHRQVATIVEVVVG
jgi:hypothetical protein